MTLNRRSFLVGGAASAAASVSTFAHAANPCSTPTTWDKAYDVIVIGSGGAGLSAGIVAQGKRRKCCRSGKTFHSRRQYYG